MRESLRKKNQKILIELEGKWNAEKKVKQKADNFLIVFLTRVIKHWNRLLMDVVHAASDMKSLKIRLNLSRKGLI